MKKYILVIIFSLVIGGAIGYFIKSPSDSKQFDSLVEHCSVAFETQEKMLRNCGETVRTLSICYVDNPFTCNEELTMTSVKDKKDELKELSKKLGQTYKETAEIIKSKE